MIYLEKVNGQVDARIFQDEGLERQGSCIRVGGDFVRLPPRWRVVARGQGEGILC